MTIARATARSLVRSVVSAVTRSQGSSVPAAPTITQQPSNATKTEGQTATFSVRASGYPSPAYQWQLDSGSGFADISGATSRDYTTGTLTTSDDGNQYKCVVTNSEGSATSNAATLTVTAAPAGNTYLQPGGVDGYLQPNGTDTYLQPT